MIQQSHCWAYTLRKPEGKETRVPNVHRSTVYNSQDMEKKKKNFPQWILIVMISVLFWGILFLFKPFIFSLFQKDIFTADDVCRIVDW